MARRRKSVLDFVVGCLFGGNKRTRKCPYSYQYPKGTKRKKF